MNDGYVIALIAGGFALGGSFITGYFTYISSSLKKEAERYKKRLVQTYQDIAAFYNLEENYTKALELNSDKSAESWKREIRAKQRESNIQTPSERATANQANSSLRDLI